jgi:dienelactone hydrolase
MDAITVSDDGLVANLYLPEAEGRHPLVIVLSGSDGGIASASWYGEPLASLGYAALALAYFAMDGLPRDLVEIPLEYFKRAIDWARAHPAIDGERIAVMGHSRGSEAALLAAAAYRDIRLVVANAPSHVSWAGIHPVPATNVAAWTRNGEDVPFLSLARPPRPGESFRVVFEESLRDAGSASSDADIPVERINGPILFVSGADDQVWPCATMADLAVARLRRHAFAFAVEHAKYEDAGHVVLIPTFRMGQVSSAWPTSSYHQPAWRSGMPMPQMGGTPDGNRLARMDAWPKTIEFLRRHL